MKNEMTFNEARDYAESTTPCYKELTYGDNGYPKFGQYRRIAFFGFDDFQEAELLAKEIGGVIEKIHWRNGWQLAESVCEAFEPLHITSDSYGDNYAEWCDPKEELDALKERISEMDDIDDIEFAVSAYCTCKEEYDSSDDQHFILVCWNKYCAMVRRRPMKWSHDTHNYAIAVVVHQDKY